MDKQTAHCDTTPETLAITSVPIQKGQKYISRIRH